MKRLMMVIAIAVAANFAAFGVQPASAVDAHHPAQTTKSKKVKAPAPKKAKSTKRSQMMMQCPMMKGGMKQGGMMQGGMMKCPMMGASNMRDMKMMHGAGHQMMGSPAMRHGEVMMGHRNPCWVITDRERGFGYQGACSH